MTPLNNLFVERIKTQFPGEAEAFLGAIDRPVVPSVRMHPIKSDVSVSEAIDDVNAKPIPWNGDGYWLDQRPNYTLNPLFHVGAFYPQEASSMFLRHVLKAVEAEMPSNPVVLDLCAAPGGKTTLLASWLDGKGVLVANEYVRQRAWILRENMAKWGYGNCLVANCDSARIGGLGSTFDLVLIDAPCSGEGMFRKDDVARTEWSVENAAMCAERQKEILDNIWDAVAENGVVIYSTCTFNPDENERQMEWLAEQYDVQFIDIDVDKEWNVTEVPFNGGRGYAFHPHRVEGEGFFICAMKKLDGMGKRRAKTDKKSPWSPSKLKVDYLNGHYSLYQNGDDVFALPAGRELLMTVLADALKAIWVGVPIGKSTRKELIPAEELALQIDFNPASFGVVNVEKDDALRFLRGEWTCEDSMAQGWNVVRYKAHFIGFVKVIGNRVNNYWPKEWRIRMDF